jgi:hypothetical protein
MRLHKAMDGLAGVIDADRRKLAADRAAQGPDRTTAGSRSHGSGKAKPHGSAKPKRKTARLGRRRAEAHHGAQREMTRAFYGAIDGILSPRCKRQSWTFSAGAACRRPDRGRPAGKLRGHGSACVARCRCREGQRCRCGRQRDNQAREIPESNSRIVPNVHHDHGACGRANDSSIQVGHDRDEGTQHRVTIAKNFAVGHVTFAVGQLCGRWRLQWLSAARRGWGRGTHPVIL